MGMTSSVVGPTRRHVEALDFYNGSGEVSVRFGEPKALGGPKSVVSDVADGNWEAVNDLNRATVS